MRTSVVSATTHRADIDGLRAVAIIGVLTYHFGLGVPGGYGGVDVFFVISGFLIAGIIKAELESGTFSLTRFYVRRVRRILPALVVCALITTIVALNIFFSFDLVSYAKTLTAVATATSNFAFVHQYASYFGNNVSENPFLHTWSLSIEEQFYAAFPLIAALLFRYRRATLVPLMLLIAAVSFALSVRLVAHFPFKAFFSTEGRIWELLLGTTLAFGLVSPLRYRVAREAEAILGVGMIIACFAFYSSATPFPGIAALPLCLGSALVIHSGTDRPTAEPAAATLVARVLSSAPAVAMGLISYSVYLWHWPLLVLARYRFSDVFEGDRHFQIMLILAALSVVLGALSWRYVEQPFRRPLPPKDNWRALATAAVTLAALYGGAKFIAKRPELVQTWPPEIVAVTGQSRNPLPPPSFGARTVPGWPEETYELGRGADKPDALLWGDSHAVAILPGLVDYLEKSEKRMLAFVHYGCPPLMHVNLYGSRFAKTCRGLNDKILAAVLKSGIKRVVLEASWENLANRKFEVSDPSTGEVKKAESFDAVFQATVRTLLDHDKEIVIVGPLPNQDFEGSRSLARFLAWGTPLHQEESLDHFKQRNKQLLILFARLDQDKTITVLYPDKWLCDDYGCPFLKDRVPLYLDRDHLSPAGASELTEMYAQFFSPPRYASAFSDSPGLGQRPPLPSP